MPDLSRGKTMKEKIGMLDENMFKVHKLDQVNFPEDYNLPKATYKKIQRYMEKHFGKYK